MSGPAMRAGEETTASASTADTTDIRPFQIPEAPEALDDLRARLLSTRWPEPETVFDAPTRSARWSQGIPLELVRELCDYWANGYDWPARAAALNELEHAVTRIDDLDIHFVHIRSPRADAIPLILTHGWPGSFVEFLDVAPLLTDPPPTGAQGTTTAAATPSATEPTPRVTTPDPPAFHLVLPSLPGFAFSAKPTDPGWTAPRIARAWVELMRRLDYDEFLAAGSDWGVSVSEAIATQFPERLLGLHIIPPLAAPDPDTFDDLTAAEQRALVASQERDRDGSAYGELQRTTPQTIGYALVDSPAALAAWIAEKFWQWSDLRDVSGDLFAVIDRDRILDNLMMYWLPATGASSARMYWEWLADVDRRLGEPGAKPVIAVPTGASVFPAEVPRPSRRWAERRFSDIRYWGEPRHGGHFAAMEQPQLFADEVRACARALGLVGGSVPP